jgi:hypothetical protein
MKAISPTAELGDAVNFWMADNLGVATTGRQ